MSAYLMLIWRCLCLSWLVVVSNLFELFSRSVRVAACEQFYLMITRCSGDSRPLSYFTVLLFAGLEVPFCCAEICIDQMT